MRLQPTYHWLLPGLPGLGLPDRTGWARSNWRGCRVRLPPGADQLAVMRAVLDRSVATRRGLMCAHLEPAYAGLETRFPPAGVEAHAKAASCRRCPPA